jgi:uncharacterized protein
MLMVMSKNVFRLISCWLLAMGIFAGENVLRAQDWEYRVIAFYNADKSSQSIQFVGDAIRFLNELGKRGHFKIDSTADWSKLNETFIGKCRLLIWLNDVPRDPQQRKAFENYMKKGGGWLGFHDGGYNDQETGWPWFQEFMGGAIFKGKNVPALPARLIVENSSHFITRRVPPAFASPANEWYQWEAGPDTNKHVQVLVSLDTGNYPLGMKEILSTGATPVVWTNTHYRMLYINMGYGDKTFSDFLQNHLIEDGILWLFRKK